MSNRTDFLEIREREALENPQDYEHPEEKKPMCIDDWLKKYEAEEKNKYKAKYGNLPYHLNLDARSTDHTNGRMRQELAKYGYRDVEFIKKFYNKQSVKLDKGLIYHHNAKPLNAFQKLYHVAECSEETKNKNLKNIEDGFKNLRSKSRSV